MTLSTLGTGITLHKAVGGTASIVLAKHRHENRMQPLLTFVDDRGAEHVVALSTPDVIALTESLVLLHSAEQPQIAEWWAQLTGKESDQ